MFWNYFENIKGEKVNQDISNTKEPVNLISNRQDESCRYDV